MSTSFDERSMGNIKGFCKYILLDLKEILKDQVKSCRVYIGETYDEVELTFGDGETYTHKQEKPFEPRTLEQDT